MLRATVAGILLCTETPERWFPNAAIMATRYRGADRASGQLDAQQIVGPVHQQIAEAVRFAVRNMRVAARKTPGRVDMPQYSPEAIFEALVNAVAHRDYSMSGRRIRLSMFEDRLEIDSPGALPNGMTIASMEASQATRNEVIASVFGRLSVGDIPGSENRQFLMERRGDGVVIIVRKTRETAGRPPVYAVIDESNVQLTIPAADLELTAGASRHHRAVGGPAADRRRDSGAVPERDLEEWCHGCSRRGSHRAAQHASPDDRVRRGARTCCSRRTGLGAEPRGSGAGTARFAAGRRSHFLRGGRSPSGPQRTVESDTRCSRSDVPVRRQHLHQRRRAATRPLRARRGPAADRRLGLRAAGADRRYRRPFRPRRVSGGPGRGRPGP